MRQFMLLSVLFTAAFLGGCATGEKAAKVDIGMSVTEVQRIMGRADSVSPRDIGGMQVVEHVYLNRLMSGWSWNRADYVFQFQANRLVAYGPRNVVENDSAAREAALRSLAANQPQPSAPQPLPTYQYPMLSTGSGTRTETAERETAPQLPSGNGIPTSRTKLGPNGKTWYEMRAVNGVIYWTDVRPY